MGQRLVGYASAHGKLLRNGEFITIKEKIVLLLKPNDSKQSINIKKVNSICGSVKMDLTRNAKKRLMQIGNKIGKQQYSLYLHNYILTQLQAYG